MYRDLLCGLTYTSYIRCIYYISKEIHRIYVYNTFIHEGWKFEIACWWEIEVTTGYHGHHGVWYVTWVTMSSATGGANLPLPSYLTYICIHANVYIAPIVEGVYRGEPIFCTLSLMLIFSFFFQNLQLIFMHVYMCSCIAWFIVHIQSLGIHSNWVLHMYHLWTINDNYST